MKYLVQFEAQILRGKTEIFVSKDEEILEGYIIYRDGEPLSFEDSRDLFKKIDTKTSESERNNFFKNEDQLQLKSDIIAIRYINNIPLQPEEENWLDYDISQAGEEVIFEDMWDMIYQELVKREDKSLFKIEDSYQKPVENRIIDNCLDLKPTYRSLLALISYHSDFTGDWEDHDSWWELDGFLTINNIDFKGLNS